MGGVNLKSEFSVRRALSFVALLTLLACATDETITSAGASVQSLRAGHGELGETFLALDLLATDSSGEAVGCDTVITANVSVKVGDGPSETISRDRMRVACTGPSAEMALVIDNSGSLNSVGQKVREAAHVAADKILSGGGRVSVVRVGSNARVLTELTSDRVLVARAIDGLATNSRSWTALYDGVRVGNETLGGATHPSAAGGFSDSSVFCAANRKVGIVAFTDGQENNSAGQKYASDDGINTTLNDVQQLSVDGITTPIYSVGLGRQVDHSALRSIAEATGGRHFALNEPSDIAHAFDHVTDYASSTHQVCAELPRRVCGDVHVTVDYNYETGSGVATGSRTYSMFVPCPVVARDGKSAAVVLTFNNPSIPRDDAATLAQEIVNAVAPRNNPTVLVVLDDNHHGESQDDAAYVKSLLVSRGFQADLINEPSNGIREEQLDGYDVVWFSNPGYPVDDLSSMQAIAAFRAHGGSVVLQGDDITWSMGASFSMTPYTKLRHVDNGTNFCGRLTDNNAGARFAVRFGDNAPASLAGKVWNYGDDIDVSVPIIDDPRFVLASATLPGTNCGSIPVVTIYDPELFD